MIHVKNAERTDLDALAALMAQMDRFYGTTEFDPLGVRVRQIDQALFVPQPAAYALLAWDDRDLVGFAAYSYLWPAVGLTRSLYLKELYVDESRRRDGVGVALMGEIFTIAESQGCSRVEWATDLDNAGAQRFYGKLGFQQQSSKINYRAEGAEVIEAVARLARRPVALEREEGEHGL